MRKDVYVPWLCKKSHWRYFPHIKSTQKTYRTKQWRHMPKKNSAQSMNEQKKIERQTPISYKMKTNPIIGIT